MVTITSVRRYISVRCLHFTIHMLFLLKGLSSAADAQVTQKSQLILLSSSRSVLPLRNIHFSNGNESFPFYIIFALPSFTDKILIVRLDYKLHCGCNIITGTTYHSGELRFTPDFVCVCCFVCLLFVSSFCVFVHNLACVCGLSFRFSLTFILIHANIKSS